MANAEGPSKVDEKDTGYSSRPTELGKTGYAYNTTTPLQARWPGLILQPDLSVISEEQLTAEIKDIYAGLVIVEAKCINIDAAQASDPAGLGKDQWQALIALHRTLLYEHHDFLMATQHSSATPAFRAIPSKYYMPARMWKHGIHAFLEVLRRRCPESQDYMMSFIYLAYQMMNSLYGTVPIFLDTWFECLGDLARYRMAMEEENEPSQWGEVAVSWYAKAYEQQAQARQFYRQAVTNISSLFLFGSLSNSLSLAFDEVDQACQPIRAPAQAAQNDESIVLAALAGSGQWLRRQLEWSKGALPVTFHSVLQQDVYDDYYQLLPFTSAFRYLRHSWNAAVVPSASYNTGFVWPGQGATTNPLPEDCTIRGLVWAFSDFRPGWFDMDYEESLEAAASRFARVLKRSSATMSNALALAAMSACIPAVFAQSEQADRLPTPGGKHGHSDGMETMIGSLPYILLFLLALSFEGLTAQRYLHERFTLYNLFAGVLTFVAWPALVRTGDDAQSMLSFLQATILAIWFLMIISGARCLKMHSYHVFGIIAILVGGVAYLVVNLLDNTDASQQGSNGVQLMQSVKLYEHALVWLITLAIYGMFKLFAKRREARAQKNSSASAMSV